MTLGPIVIDRVCRDEALERIANLVTRGAGGSVFTPNVDHVVMADENAAFRAAYAGVDLSLVDGVPVVWATRLLGAPAPEKLSGSDFVLPLVELCAARGYRLYLLGGADGVATEAARLLRERFPALAIAGVSAPRVDMGEPPEARREIVEALAAAKPDVVFVAFGAPKQELFIEEIRRAVPAVYMGVGASLDFISGRARRAPGWMSDVGLEWLHRLAHDPKRLAARYLLRDPKFLLILGRAVAARLRAASSSS